MFIAFSRAWDRCAFFCFLLGGSTSLFGNDLTSARRQPGENYQQAEQRYLKALQRKKSENNFNGNASLTDNTAHGAAVKISSLKFDNLPVWTAEDITEEFAEARDNRFLHDQAHPNFLRRITWLYPMDGCYARAALFSDQAENSSRPRPARIFAFGNLVVKTPYSPSGSVSWWYHVAPLIMGPGKKPMVLDPAIDSKNPMTPAAWFKAVSADSATLKGSVCSPHTYSPSSACLNTSPSDDSEGEVDQLDYLTPEWNNLLELHKDPKQELGDNPPWSHF